MPGELTPSQLLAMAAAGQLDMDAGAERPAADTNTAATTTTTTNADAANAADASTAATDAANGEGTQDDEKPAPIASKSGAYQIPYDKLVEARNERDQFKQERDQAKQERDLLRSQVEQLNAQAQANLAQQQENAQSRADAGQGATQADKNLEAMQKAAASGVDMTLFGDFSEEAIAEGLVKYVEQVVSQRLAPMQQEAAQRAELTAQEAHLKAIYGKHPDAGDLVESTQWNQWLASQPAFARAAIEQVMQSGSTAQVIEVFDTFKAAQGNAATVDPLKAAIEAAGKQVPNTLSDLPGGVAGKSDAEVLSVANNPGDLLGAFAGKTPEQIERMMNSV